MACLIIFMSLCAIMTTVNGGNSHPRQSHFGFMGTRGKRSINDDHGNNLNDESVLSNLSQVSLETKNQQNDEHVDRYISDYLRNNLPESSNFKRPLPQPLFLSQSYGNELDPFSIDMRGRRISPLTAFNRIIMNSNPKRAPYGFMGMRGKKQEIFIDNKRVPVGFLGTRGKKDLNDYEEYNYDDNIMGNYQNSELQNLYRPNTNQQDQRKLDTWTLINENKRAPTSSGFFGMRGKKFYNSDTDNIDAENINNRIDDFEKRAPTGFLGMRGKKFYFNTDDNALNIQQASSGTVDATTEKRKMNGFFGVRGKKDVSSQLLNEDKRSFAQFFGIRGKKQPFNSGFFGMRGKKQPLQFRGKFVGVRGKKSLEESSMVSNELKTDDNNIGRMLSVNDDEFVMKRNPSGFIGMRGKKIPDIDETSNKN